MGRAVEGRAEDKEMGRAVENRENAVLTDLFWRFSFACECHLFPVVELSKHGSSAYYVSSFKTQLSSCFLLLFLSSSS